MTKKAKLKQRIMHRPYNKDITFDEIKTFLLEEGFEMTEGKGDHKNLNTLNWQSIYQLTPEKNI